MLPELSTFELILLVLFFFTLIVATIITSGNPIIPDYKEYPEEEEEAIKRILEIKNEKK